MQILNVTQGSPEWHAARAKHHTASEAPAMMGQSKYSTRAALLKQKAIGAEEVIDAAKQRLFDRGHETEALARTILESRLGEDLFPVTAADDDGYLLASLDGLTMDESTGFEHKLWNEDLAAQVRSGELEPHYYWQLEQQILVCGLEKVIFVCSDGTEENFVSMEYRPVPGRAGQLMSGWRQFDNDLADYQHVEVVQQPVGERINDLPTLLVQVEGRVVSSNLQAFEANAKAVIAKINTDLQTDQDFADAEQAIKFCDDGEKKLELVKAQALAQTATIDELFRALDSIKADMRSKRLELEKLVKNRKESIRAEIMQSGKDRLAAHIKDLNTRLGKPLMPAIPSDFAGAMKGKKTVASLRNAVDTELAQAKIEADATFERINKNLVTLAEMTKDYGFLFADSDALVQKSNDDLVTAIKYRISEHEQAQARKKAEAEAGAAASPVMAQAAPDALSSATVSSIPTAKPVEPMAAKQAAVVGNEEVIRRFMESREFGKESNKVRAILIEFVKFQAEQQIKEAA